MHLQLSFADLPEPDDRGKDIDLGSMERLGETFEFGYMLLELLTLGGWQVVVTKPFAGQDDQGHGDRAGVLVIAERGPYEVRRVGASVATVASDVFCEAMMLAQWRIGQAA